MEHVDKRPWAGRLRRLGRPIPLLAAVLITMVAAASAGAIAGEGQDEARHLTHLAAVASPPPPTVPAPSIPVSLALDPSHEGRPIPAAYLGLSFEVTDLRRIAGYGAHGDLATLLRSLGPGLLRFGGVSADTRIAWRDGTTPAPAWTSLALEPRDLAALRSLAERSGWKVLLTVGLAHYEPGAAAREAATAKRLLGPWLAAIEVGNEPDAYARHHLRRLPWDFAHYDAEVRAYRSAIARLVPGVPLAGPGVSGSHVFVKWGSREAAREHPILLTGHHYPLGCHQQPAPSIERLLSPATRVAEGSSLRRYMAVARASRIPFRMDEANSVSCGGQAGISDTFASTLWATGYIAQALGAGVSGLNFEGNPANCLGYSPVCAATAARLTAGALTAQPLWYALLLTSGLAGDRPLRSTLLAPAGTNMAISALRTPAGGLRFLIVDDEPAGAPAASVALPVGSAFKAAAVLPLTAPSPEATSGIRLAGADVAPDGSLTRMRPASLPTTGGVVTVTVPASSAALVTAGG